MLRSPRFAASCAVALVLLAACGREPDENTAATEPAPTSAAAPSTAAATTEGAPTSTVAGEPTTTLEKPPVEIPDEIPTELVITDIETGSGREAENGDRVLVHYVGVRSEDGVEFDNSFETGQPFPVVLGAGGVIPGWDQGLVGIQAGGRRQLDIPSELAYGDRPRGEVIRANEALSFVIDAIAIIPVTDPADAPEAPDAPGANVDELVIEELDEGEGDEIEEGTTALVNVALFSADTGEQLYSSWENGAAEEIPYPNDADILEGLVDGLDGMKIGGRRLLTIPFEQAYGAEGNPDLGLAPGADLLIVVELVGQF